MKDLRTIILAAGKGTRMKSSIPKVLHKVCGKPIIQYVLDVVKSIGSLKNYIVLGHERQKIEEHLRDDYEIIQQKKLLGTADAVLCAESYFRGFKGDVLILCGDTPLLNKNVIKAIIRKHRQKDAACTFLTTVVHDPTGYGRIIRDDKGNAFAIREENDLIESECDIEEINVGVYCFRKKDLFSGLKEIKLNQMKKEYYLTDIIELFSEKLLKIQTVETDDPLEGLGVNTREDLAVAEQVVRHRILSDLMLSGVTIQDPDTTYVSANVKIGGDTVIRPFTFVEEGVQIGRHCCIGPFARIRPGCRIADHVEIGNFTEVSRTKMGRHTIMKHFGFLGDAVVGDKVNIGAGTVTANYDGIHKNKTRILDKAFIGSDSILVAPVKVGKKAVVGAGSVVTKGKSIPDGAVAYGVPAQINPRRKNK